jgi:Uma2 family endonuclease
MSAVVPGQNSLYQRLTELPENVVGEIIDGKLYRQPRPAAPHANATSVLGMEIGSAFHRARGGPGGWWIIDEPELHFILDAEVDVPDLAGWRRERMPRPPSGHRVTVVPDWVCEVLSPSTESKDRQIKMPIYARFGVAYAWLVDPLKRTLEAYALADGNWVEIGRYGARDRVSVTPFDAITIDLTDLWLPDAEPGGA